MNRRVNGRAGVVVAPVAAAQSRAHAGQVFAAARATVHHAKARRTFGNLISKDEKSNNVSPISRMIDTVVGILRSIRLTEGKHLFISPVLSLPRTSTE